MSCSVEICFQCISVHFYEPTIKEVLMLKALIILVLIGLSACSSVNKTGDEKTDAAIEHLSQSKKPVGDDFKEKFKVDGFIDGNYVAISSLEDSQYANETNLRGMGEADAMARLLQSAPTDYKKIVQRAISSVNGDNGSFSSSFVAITEAKALIGLKSNFDDFQCVVYAVSTSDLGYKFIKECRTIMRVPVSNLMKSYSITLDKKYGIKEDDLQEILKKELMGVSITKKAVGKE